MTPLPIPDAALDGDVAIVGRKGGGKSVTGKVIVERLLDLQRRVLVLDPLGHWFGLRTSADGERPGYPVAIFGGEHGDLPLDPAAAGPLAGIVARENLPAILDLSDLSKTAQQGFLLAFLHELRRVNRDALTVVLEEADVFAPQNPQGDDSKALHSEIDWLARRGRFRGFRLVTISQRPARLSKDVLTQAATLVAHRLPAPQDRKAVEAWIEGNGDRDKAREVTDTLAGLAVGEAWIWSPEHDILGRFRWPMTTTLDTSATPKAGEKRIEPKTLADVDLAPIREALAAAEPEAKPAAKVARDYARPDPAALAEAEQRGYERGKAEAFASGREAGRMEAARELVASLPGWIMAMATPAAQLPAAPIVGKSHKAPANAGPTPISAPSGEGEKINTGLTGPQKHLLKALAWWQAMHHDRPTRTQVAAIAGWKPKGSNLRNRLSELSGLGLVTYPSEGRVSLTPEGMAAAPAPDVNVTLIDSIRAALTKPQLALFEVLLAAGGTVGRTELAHRVGWEPGGSNLRNRLSELSALEVVEYPSRGGVRLQNWVTE